MNLFIIKAQASDLAMATLYRSITPFLLAPILLVALLFLMPKLALWLPGVLF
jgi:TRAP-type C4-dicarboxylate transport system permease large subunit